ncbi:MAG: hypothetical protein Ta2D_04750 [Rickettsiales bacterium]|nr:MAG: hypothetical protein Ta2D_04750 [Rickettsiales bacterium]
MLSIYKKYKFYFNIAFFVLLLDICFFVIGFSFSSVALGTIFGSLLNIYLSIKGLILTYKHIIFYNIIRNVFFVIIFFLDIISTYYIFCIAKKCYEKKALNKYNYFFFFLSIFFWCLIGTTTSYLILYG